MTSCPSDRQSASNLGLVTEGSRNLPLAGLSKATLDLHAVDLWMVSAKPEEQTWRGEKLGLLRQQTSFFRSPSTNSESQKLPFLSLLRQCGKANIWAHAYI